MSAWVDVPKVVPVQEKPLAVDGVLQTCPQVVRVMAAVPANVLLIKSFHSVAVLVGTKMLWPLLFVTLRQMLCSLMVWFAPSLIW